MPYFSQIFLIDSSSILMHYTTRNFMFVSYCMCGIFTFVLVCTLGVLMGGFSCQDILADEETEENWIIFPILMVIGLTYISGPMLYLSSGLGQYSCTSYVTGHQWYWEYTLNWRNKGSFTYLSYASPVEDLSPGDVYLFEADNPLVLAYGVLKNGITWKTRLLVTSADVLHCFSVPSMAVKIDACPGRITEVAVVPRKMGIYVGMCSELCGRLHSAMPINVEVLNCKDYIRFVKAGVALNS